MKKIVQRVIGLILIFGIVISPLVIKAEDTETTHEAEKGTLRLNGVVADSVSVTAGSLVNDGDIQIIKTVSKTDTLGEYEVKFEVVGKNIPKTQTKKGRVVLMLDMSGSLSSDETEVLNATNIFANNMKQKNIELAIIQFAKVSRIVKNINDNSYNLIKISDKVLGDTSHVELALAQANSIFESTPSNTMKFAFS